MNIIVRIKGGMGNQMFEYACARAMQIRNRGYGLVLDLSEMEHEINGRAYGLDAFQIPKDVRILKSHRYDKYARSKNQVLRVFQKLFPEMIYRLYAKKNVFLWDDMEYRAAEIDSSRDVYLNGYWQSSRYLKDAKNQILSDFTFTTQLSEEQMHLKKQIQNSESVCVHIRLGDYLKDRNYQVCSREYYIKGMETVRDKYPNARFYVFSDDIAKASQMLFERKDMDVVCTGGSPSERIDMELMSCCRHFVISNSSFSWWAQYLSKNENKIVCAPSKWMNYHKVQSVYEKDWIRL